MALVGLLIVHVIYYITEIRVDCMAQAGHTINVLCSVCPPWTAWRPL